MTDFGASVARRYHVGITSVLRRCVAVGLFGVCLLPKAGLADYTGDSLIRSALENCVPKVTDWRTQSLLEYWTFSELPLYDASDDGRFSGNEKVWAPDNEAWFLIQLGEGLRRECEVVQYEFDFETAADKWDKFISSDAFNFQVATPADVSEDESGKRSCSRVARRVQDQFLELGFCALLHSNAWPDVQFVRVEIMDEPWGSLCTLWPEECE